MRSTRAPDQSGIALFMVMAAMTVLSIIVTEFTYIAQVNQRMAYDGFDQVKALYLAKTGLKLSLLRLKAYQQVKDFVSGQGGGKIPGVSRQLVEQIWSAPFFYPFPTNIPGLSVADKDRINDFQKSSGLDGNFTAVIESESSKFNLNMILGSAFVTTPATAPTGSAGGKPGGGDKGGDQTSHHSADGATGATGAEIDPTAARQSLHDFLFEILDQKRQSDQDFATDYRDFKLEDLVQNITEWADKTVEQRNPPDRTITATKRGPFYSLSELHMIPTMDDELYDLFAPSLTVSTTPGIDVNTMKEATLKAIVPGMTKEEVDDFFKFRDSTDEDNNFKTEDDFFKYIQDKLQAYRGEEAVKKLREDLKKRNIRIVVDETYFKITVQAQVAQATRRLEAWVVLTGKKQGADAGSQGKNPDGSAYTPPPGSPPPLSGPGPGGANNGTPTPDAGLKVTYMRII